ncbi:hypothetical protein CMUST_03315 [Corynebacterium mustelae]|uniref:Uncharacterized protein n=1 Tax=Corynebacterium mustelae TaxID=571915 RepID=A0A0G3H1L2_9CORY|nr:hypothetical protein CMUST_03315 [Corynebacterium mustelae]
MDVPSLMPYSTNTVFAERRRHIFAQPGLTSIKPRVLDARNKKLFRETADA